MSSGLFATPTPTPLGIPQADGSGFIDTGWLHASVTPTPNDLVLSDGSGHISPDWLIRGNFYSPNIFQQTDGTGAVLGTGIALTLSTQVQKSVWAGPISGANAAPTFRLLASADIPDLSGIYQPLNTHLTNFGALSDGTGWLYNNGAGTFGYTTPTKGDVGLGSVLNLAQEPALGNPSVNGYVLSSTTAGVRSWIPPSSGSGTVTSVGSGTGLTGGPITGSGSLAVAGNLATLFALANSAGWLHNNGAGALAYSTPTKSDVGLSAVENTALSTWAGSFNLTRFGNVDLQNGIAGLNNSTRIPSALLSTPRGSISEQGRWSKYASNPILVGLPGFEESAVQEPNVIFENGVFKMWYSAGWMNQSLCYATSPDGFTWTKYVSNPILGQGGSGISGVVRCTTVIKIDGVYFCYYADANPNANLKIAKSNDGLSWSVVGTAIVNNAIPGIGGWANTAVWRDPSGVWYMIVEGFITATSTWRMYLLSGSDGLTWSFLNSSNPLSSLQVATGGMYGGPNVPIPFKIDGNYHLWYHACAVSGGLPTNIYHAYSPDLINWTIIAPNPALSLSGSGYEIDQVADACIVEANGKTWMFFDAENNAISVGAIEVATFNGALQDIINKCGSVVRNTDSPSFSGAYFNNNTALNWADSSAVYRRTFLWSTLNNLYYGDIDNTNNSNVFLLAGGTGRFEFYFNGTRHSLINSTGFETDGYLRTGNPSGGLTEDWKLGDYSSGLINIDINGNPYKLVTSNQGLAQTVYPQFSGIVVAGSNSSTFDTYIPYSGDNNVYFRNPKVNIDHLLVMTGVPTSPTGQPAGTVWKDTTGGLNILKIV
jgi:hypothetical protein